MNETAIISDELNQRLAAIPASAQLRLVPIRHHSPACAAHLQQLIEKDQPELILIEGPADATPLIEYLADTDAQAPLALYFYHCAKPGDWLSAQCGEDATVRHRGFYPLAEFSPEWVAIQAGAKSGAQVKFIDLPYAQHNLRGDIPTDGSENSLLNDQPLATADPTAKMVEASGCRDFNEWWDRYFESGGASLEPTSYFHNVLLWCLMLRDANHEQVAEQAENCAREAFMAEHIREAIETGKRVMVITGGFHTEALASLLAKPKAAATLSPVSGEQGLYIVPYTLGRLDAANGYVAGIANSGYYQEVWQQHTSGNTAPHQGAAEQVALRVARALKDRGELVSMPDCIEAIALSRRLAALRDVAPGRAEILDAMQTAFIKDTHRSDTNTEIIKLLSFDLKGQVPKRYPAAPLVEDFRNQCIFFKLPLGPLDSTEKQLAIYRSERHRQISRLLHRVAFLDVPYAQMTAGPNFATGQQLQRVREVWSLQWSPETEALLTERMAYGGQLEEAALNLLLEKLETEPQQSPGLLIKALGMGLHQALDHVLSHVQRWLENEGRFITLVKGLKLLALAHGAQNALAANQLPALRPLLAECFERACLRLSWIGQTSDEEALEQMTALSELNALARSSLDPDGDSWADVALFTRCVESLHNAPVSASLRGCAAGILTARQIWSDLKTEQALTEAFNEALANPTYLGGYLLGFLPVARGFLVQAPTLACAMNTVVSQWSEEVFLDALPNLRLAFTSLKPRETIALSQILGFTLSENQSSQIKHLEWNKAELNALQDLAGDASKALTRWGFGGEENLK